MIRSHYIYKGIWTLFLEEKLELQCEASTMFLQWLYRKFMLVSTVSQENIQVLFQVIDEWSRDK